MLTNAAKKSAVSSLLIQRGLYILLFKCPVNMQRISSLNKSCSEEDGATSAIVSIVEAALHLVRWNVEGAGNLLCFFL